MSTAVMFVSNLEMGPAFFYPAVISMVVLVAWFAYEK